MKSIKLLCIFLFSSMVIVQTAAGTRIKDIAQLGGVRENQLIGYGLVTGLAGTGDDLKKVLFTRQALYNMMVRQGITINPTEFEKIKSKNVAAVMVTASLPPFAKPGSTIDILVSSIGDAQSLAGGNLLMTALKGPDNKVYAVAQGPMTISAFSFGGKAAKAQKNHPTVGRIASGAIIEQTVPVALGQDGTLSYRLRSSDFSTAANMSDEINSTFGDGTANPIDSTTVKVTIPDKYKTEPVPFIARLESLDIKVDTNAKVVINERTGTIVMGQDVRLSTVAVSHGNLSIVIKESADVVQPNPLAPGETVVIPQTSVAITEEEGGLTVVKEGVSISAVADALNAIGATPRDLIAIFQAIKAAGAMQGELIVL
ncbi:MAG: flagellar basal body P-ring protein FlgI [Proteobacteria bacterium]|nr:flagellar basal body P-ring protein FlgI [Pseudomonadota bacterium]MBU1649793.1 flagellar basal body P-ring protein FlgI [Pseudomonadota bacterium]